MARLKFIADADLNQILVRELRRRVPEIDFLTALEGATRGLSDPDVLSLAAATGRVLVSSDRNTMVRHYADFLSRQDSPGLVIVRQRANFAHILDDLALIWADSTDTQLRNRIRWVPFPRSETMS